MQVYIHFFILMEDLTIKKEKKIDDLVKINKKLESRLNEMYQTSLTHGRSGNDTVTYDFGSEYNSFRLVI